jgi:hypothetical protein
MEKQLTLVDTPRTWKLDRRTREIGRKGVADAREALRRAGTNQAPPSRPRRDVAA